METLANCTYHHQHHRQHPLTLNLHHHRRASISKPISSISFKPSSFSSPIKASFSPPPSPIPNPLKNALIVSVTAAAVFISQLNLKHARASPPPPPATVESEFQPDPETVMNLEQKFDSDPKDIKSLRKLMEIRLKAKKFNEGITLLDELLRLEPNNEDWPMLKAYLHIRTKNHKASKKMFNEIILKDPFRIEAYNGLIMVASVKNVKEDLIEAEEKVEEGLEKAKKAKDKTSVREFNVLLAQVLFLKEDYDNALRIYEDLIEDEPTDFRPYLCQGIIYIQLKKFVDAEDSFDKYTRLYPKGKDFVDDIMSAATGQEERYS